MAPVLGAMFKTIFHVSEYKNSVFYIDYMSNSNNKMRGVLYGPHPSTKDTAQCSVVFRISPWCYDNQLITSVGWVAYVPGNTQLACTDQEQYLSGLLFVTFIFSV